MKIFSCRDLTLKQLPVALVSIVLPIVLTACQSQATQTKVPKMASTYCAEHELLAGVTIKKSDLHEAEADISNFIEAPVTDLSQVIGRKPCRTIDSGNFILKSDFEEEPPTEGIICFAKERILKGQPVKPSSIEGRRYKQIPKYWMPITAANQVVGRTSAVALEKGSPVAWYHLKGEHPTKGGFYELPQPTQNLQPTKEQLTAQDGFGKVVIATRKIKQDEVFRPTAIAEIFAPQEKIPQSAVTEKMLVVDRLVARDVDSGQWIMQGDLAPQGKGMRVRPPRSVVVVKNIKAGQVISKSAVEENTHYADRVENGSDIVGLKAKHTIEKGTPILWYSFEGAYE